MDKFNFFVYTERGTGKRYTLGEVKEECLVHGEFFPVFHFDKEHDFTGTSFVVHGKPATITKIITEDYQDVNFNGDFPELHPGKKTQLRMELESNPAYALKEKFIVTYREHIYAK